MMAIEKVSFPSPWSRSLFEEEIGREFSDVIVAVEDPEETVAGYAICWTVGGGFPPVDSAVRAGGRGRGGGGRCAHDLPGGPAGQ